MDQGSSIGKPSNSAGKEVIQQPENKTETVTSIVETSKSKGKEVIAHVEDIALANLKATDTDKAIYVRVYRKWTPTNRQGRPVVFCCMLIDRQV